jgi:4'-phosphopantetheinyl transferase
MAACAGSDADAEAIPVRWRTGTEFLSAPAAAPAAAGWVFGSFDGSRRLVADFDEIIVIGIRDQSQREAARQAIRAAIAAELAALSGLPLPRIALHTAEGQAPHALLDTPGGTRQVGLAISHDGALSVAAICAHGAVGIDVTLVMDIPDWEALARDYLGPDVATALSALPAPARAHALARAWSEREARLKCLGRELTEWSEDGDRALAACRCRPLVLPEGYAGALALL